MVTQQKEVHYRFGNLELRLTSQNLNHCNGWSSIIPRMVTQPTNPRMVTHQKDLTLRLLWSNYCHTRLHLGFSAKLRIWQVPTCKMEPQSGFITTDYEFWKWGDCQNFKVIGHKEIPISDSQLSWESKMEPSVAIITSNKCKCQILLMDDHPWIGG